MGQRRGAKVARRRARVEQSRTRIGGAVDAEDRAFARELADAYALADQLNAAGVEPTPDQLCTCRDCW